jgi:hypothetical protein
MSKHSGKGVKQVMKGFLSGARKMVHPREDKAIFVGSPFRGRRRSQLLRHVEEEGLSQQRRVVREICNIIFT